MWGSRAIWEISEHFVERWSLYYPCQHGPSAAGSPTPESCHEQGERCHPCLQTTKNKMFAQGFLASCFQLFFLNSFTVFVQACRTRGHKQAFQNKYWWTITILSAARQECKLRRMNAKEPQWGMCSFSRLSILFHTSSMKAAWGPQMVCWATHIWLFLRELLLMSRAPGKLEGNTWSDILISSSIGKGNMRAWKCETAVWETGGAKKLLCSSVPWHEWPSHFDHIRSLLLQIQQQWDHVSEGFLFY